ncbi:MAG: PAS domain S-box protein [Desulfuromonadaceae bacterium]
MFFPKISTIATTDVVTLPDSASIREAVQLMKQHNIRNVVVRAEQRYRLFLSSRLVELRLSGCDLNTPLSQIELPYVPLIGADVSVVDAIKAIDNQSQHLCIAGADNNLCGIVSYTDLASSLDPQMLAETQSLGELIRGVKATSIEPNISLDACMSLMADRKITAAVVTTDDKPLGILTQRDMIDLIDSQADLSQCVTARMSTPLKTLGDTSSVAEALEFCRINKVKRVVVVDHHGRLSGVISQKELVTLYYNQWFSFFKNHQQELEKANKELEKANQQLSVITDEAPGGILVADANGKIVRANKTAANILGTEHDKLTGLPVQNFFAFAQMQICKENSVSPFGSEYEENIYSQGADIPFGQGYSLNGQSTIIAADGRERVVDLRSRCLSEEGSVVLLFHDVTSQAKDQKYTRQALARFTGGPVVVFDWIPQPGWPVSYVSGNVRNALGYSVDELKSPDFSFVELLHPEDKPRIEKEVVSALERKAQGWEQNYRLKHKNGEYRWFYDYTVPEYGEDGRPELIRGYILDRTDDYVAQQKIAQNEERWRFVLEATQQGVWDWDASRDEVYFSPQWKHMLGHDDHEVGTSLDEWKKRVHPDDMQSCLNDLERHLRGETDAYENEHRVLCKDGSYLRILDRGKVISRDEHGAPLRVIGTHTDISEQYRLVQQIEKQKNLFHTLFHLYPDASLLIDLDTQLPLEFNHQAHEQLGYTAEEFATLRISDYEACETPEETEKHIHNILQHGRDDFETRHRRKDGSLVDVRVTVVLLNWQEQTCLLSVFRDISEQKKILLDLAQSEKRFMDVAMAAGEYIWEIDVEGRYNFITAPVEPLLGYPVDQIIGHSPFEYMPVDEARRVEEMLSECAAEKKSWQGLEHESIRSDGSLVYQRVSGLPILGEDDELLGFRGTGRDITEQKRAEQRAAAIEAVTQKQRVALDAIAHTIAAEDRVGAILSTTCQNLGVALKADRAMVYDIDFGRGEIAELDEWVNPESSRVSPSVGTSSLMTFGAGIAHMQEQRIPLISHVDKVHPALLEDGSASIQHNQMGVKSLLWYPFAFHDGGYRLIVLNWLERQAEPDDQQLSFLASVTRLVKLAQNKILMLEQQQEVQKQYKMLFEEMQDGFALHEIICNDQGIPVDYRYLAVNPAFERLTGLRGEDVVGRRVREVLPEIEQHWIDSFGQVALGGENCTIEDYSAELGRYLNITAFQPEPGRFACLLSDITQRIKAQQELVATKERFSGIFQQTSSGVAVYHPVDGGADFKFVDYNQAAANMDNVERDAVVGRRVTECFPGVREMGLLEAFQRVYATGEPEKIPISQYQDSDLLAWRENRVFRLSSGEVVAIFDDLTEIKQAQQLSEQAREAAECARLQAEEASRAKSDFLANMSHEIRTPMNAIIGLSQILQQTELTETQQDYINKISHSSRMLLGIINDVLDFSKIESGKLELEQHDFEIKELIEQVGILFNNVAQQKELEFIYAIQPDLPQALVGDSLRLSQVLTNLLSNAIKFTGEGGLVEFGITRVGKPAPGRVRLQFSVRDTGIGMTEEQVARIFKVFSQADTSTTRRYGGTGLGLVISKRLVEKMGGDIEVISESGQGSTFSFTLDMPLSTEYQSSDFCPPTVGKHVLVVDDHEHARLVMRTMLEHCDFRVETACSGEESIEKVKLAEQRNEAFDFILMDWKMPGGMNGSETAAELLRLREEGELQKTRPPILMVSAYHRNEMDVPESLVSDCLHKPITPSTLYNALLAAEQGRSVAPAKKEGFSAPDLGTKQVLLVEDNEINQEVALRMLEKTGAQIDLAINGAEAIEKVGDKAPDLILMDLQMPVMDGYEATRTLRLDGYAGPIIALSAAVMEADRKRASEAGVDNHLGKPIEAKVLYSMLADYLNIDVNNQSSSTRDAQEDLLPQSIPGFDLQFGLGQMGGDQESYLRLLKQLHEGITTRWRSLIDLLKNEEMEQAQRIAHTLKGAAGTLGATELSRLATEIDHLLKGDEPVSEELIYRMEKAFDETEEALGSLGTCYVQEHQGNVDSVKQLRLKLEENELIDEELLRGSLGYLTAQGYAIQELESLIENMDFDSALTELDSMVKGE